ncbi:MAG: hypothetical protein NVSMB25_21280 [Thermoleophilaceae bacterium]
MGSGLMSPSHIALVLLVALLVLGPKRLPEVGRSLGNGLRGFRDAIGGDDHEGGIGGSLRDVFNEPSREHEAVEASSPAPISSASSSPSSDRYPLVGKDPHIAAAHGRETSPAHPAAEAAQPPPASS